jgi:hypothetical protein
MATLHSAYVLIGNAIGLVARAARLTIGGESPRPLVYEADRYLDEADELLRRTAVKDAPDLEQLRADVRALADPPASRRVRREGFAEMLQRLRSVRRAVGAVLYRDEELRRSPRPSRAPGARTTLTNLLEKAQGGRRYTRWWIAGAVLVAIWAALTMGRCAVG